ncbi:MAG: diacylglycerol kinase family protein [Acidobacteriota bacterium]
MIILLNGNSNNSHGLRKWEEIRSELEEKYLGHDYKLVHEAAHVTEDLSRQGPWGDHTVVAAGGDGTVNFLLNQLMRLEEKERRQVVLGAIALGSSNDFHKPYSETRRVNGKVHVKLDERHATAHNVGQVDYEDERGRKQSRYFIINASIGVIAQANYFFNTGDRVLNWLKPRMVLGAIYYAAIRTMFSAQNIHAAVTVDGESYSTEVTTLGVFINPHFSGNLRYDLDVTPQSDFLGVALCERMEIRERLRAMCSLARGKFLGLPKTRSWKARSVGIETDSPISLEMDGEVCLARKIKIRLLQGYMKVCQ